MTARAAAFLLGAVIGGPWTTRAQQAVPPVIGTNYMYINAMEVATGQIPNEAIEEGKMWVRGLRETGEFRLARLFIHNTGPSFSIYIVLEAGWQEIENGWSKFLGSHPELFASPWKWGSHSDNVIGEIIVE